MATKHKTNDEDMVQVIFTNLVKNKKQKLEQELKFRNTNTSTNTITGVSVARILYHFSENALYEKEPNNMLMNPNKNNLKKSINPNTHTLEYVEDIPDFNLIIDYINGYDVNEFHKVFKQNYTRVADFKIVISRFGFTNLLTKMDFLYPLININGMLVNVSRRYIENLEPNNNLINVSQQSESNVFTHFRDREIFREYLLEYIQGKENINQTIDKIKILENTENKYKYSKLESDLLYYGFDRLRNKLSYIIF